MPKNKSEGLVHHKRPTYPFLREKLVELGKKRQYCCFWADFGLAAITRSGGLNRCNPQKKFFVPQKWLARPKYILEAKEGFICKNGQNPFKLFRWFAAFQGADLGIESLNSEPESTFSTCAGA